MRSILGGLVAFVAGIALATATVVGVVQSQTSGADDPVQTSNVSYGSNN